MSLTDGVPAPISVRANAPARIGPTIAERKPFGPAVPEKVRLRRAAPLDPPTPSTEASSPTPSAERSLPRRAAG